MAYIKNNIVRKMERSHEIPLEATFERVWEQIELLKSPAIFESFLKNTLSKDFFGLELTKVSKLRKEHNIILGNPKRFLLEEEVHDAAIESVVSIKQASEYFNAAHNAGPMIKPLLLYYGMVSFAKALIKSTYKVNYCNKKGVKQNLGHGLSVSEDDMFSITIRKTGEYQTFRDCYMSDPLIYARKYPLKINLKDLMAVIPGMRLEWKLAYGKKFDSAYKDLYEEPRVYSTYHKDQTYIPLKEELKISNEIFNVYYSMGDEGAINKPVHVYRGDENWIEPQKFIHVIDAYYLAMFILCHYARYRPFEWSDFLNKDGNLFLIRKFLRRAELDFPMLMYSELTGIKTYFKAFG